MKSKQLQTKEFVFLKDHEKMNDMRTPYLVSFFFSCQKFCRSLSRSSMLFFLFLGFIDCRAQMTVFYKQYSDLREVSLSSIDTTHENGAILGGQLLSTNGGDFFIMRIDSLGNEMWRKSGNYFNGGDSSSLLTSIIEASNHDYLMCGVIDLPNNVNSRSLVIRTDSVGNILWTRFVDNSSKSDAVQIIELDNSDFILYENETDFITARIILSKYNALGDTIWTKRFNFPLYKTFGITMCTSGEFIYLATTIYDTTFSPIHYWTGIIKMDTLGTIISSVQLTDSLKLYPLDIFVSDLGFINLSCSHLTSTGPATTIIRLDSSLNEISRYNFPIMEVCRFKNDTDFIGVLSGLAFFKGNISGDTTWDYFVFEEYGTGSDVTFDKTGCALFSGIIDDGQNTTAIGFVMKICDSTLVNTTSDKLIIDNKPILITNYYNKTITLILNENHFKDGFLKLDIFDINGKLVFTLNNIDSLTTTFNSNILSTGFYTYILQNKKFIYKNKFAIN